MFQINSETGMIKDLEIKNAYNCFISALMLYIWQFLYGGCNIDTIIINSKKQPRLCLCYVLLVFSHKSTVIIIFLEHLGIRNGDYLFTNKIQ